MPSAKFTPRVVRANRRHADDRDIRSAHHGWFYSSKLDSFVPYRGTLSFDFLTLAEAHPRVLSISSKAEPVQWWNGTTWVTYHPRYVVSVRTGRRDISRSIDIEVLSSRDVKDDQLKLNRVRRECQSTGRQFLIFTERQCRVQPRLTNCKFILQHAGSAIAMEDDCQHIRETARVRGHFTLNEVVAIGTLTYPQAYSATLCLVGRGELTFPLGRRFDGNTVVRRRVGA
jgi:hypothetical protein